MVPDGECLFGFDIAEGGGLLQMFFPDDAFFVHLKHPSVSLSCSGSCPRNMKMPQNSLQ